MYRLVIGNRNYSSWSLRAWLFLRESGIDFEEIRIALFSEQHREQVARYSPAGRVPILQHEQDGKLATVWDSLAIMHYVRAREASAVGWPEDSIPCAHALAVAHEMHSGFLAIRAELPQNLRARRKLDPDRLSAACRAQIERVASIWSECRERYAERGPWLFGAFSIADVMFAPVALRFVTYGIEIDARAREFVDAVERSPSVGEWVDAAHAESESIAFVDNLVPVDQTPLSFG